MSDNLDQDFDTIAEQINQKIKEAAKALREANELRKKAGLETLIPSQWAFEYSDSDEENDALREKLEKIDVSPLEQEMDNAGWSSSSSYC